MLQCTSDFGDIAACEDAVTFSSTTGNCDTAVPFIPTYLPRSSATSVDHLLSARAQHPWMAVTVDGRVCYIFC